MKRRIPTGVLAAFIVMSLAAFVTFAGSTDKEAVRTENATIQGEVVDLWCYMDHGSRGDGHRGCGISCAKAGNAVGIVDGEGNIYVTFSAEKHMPSSGALRDKMAEKVTVKGTLVKQAGLRAIFVASIQ